MAYDASGSVLAAEVETGGADPQSPVEGEGSSGQVVYTVALEDEAYNGLLLRDSWALSLSLVSCTLTALLLGVVLFIALSRGVSFRG